MAYFLQRGGGRYLGILALLMLISAALLVQTVGERYRCEASRLALADRLDALDSARRNVAVSQQLLREPEKVLQRRSTGPTW